MLSPEQLPVQLQGSALTYSTLMHRFVLALNRTRSILHGASMNLQPPPGALPEGAFSGQERVFEALEKSDREQRLSGPLAEFLGLLTLEERAGKNIVSPSCRCHGGTRGYWRCGRFYRSSRLSALNTSRVVPRTGRCHAPRRLTE